MIKGTPVLYFFVSLFFWAGVDFLLAGERSQARRFLMQIKEPMRGDLAIPAERRLTELQKQAFADIWGRSVAEMEAAWKAWITENYPKK